MNKDTIRQIAVISAFSMTLIVNWLANAMPINGQTTGDVTRDIASYFIPAPYVFAIWGVIYTGLVAYVIYQALPSQKENPRLRAMGWLFILSCIANTGWIFLWHYNFFASSILLMATLLLSLLGIYQRLGTSKFQVSRGETWAVRVPFSIYLGWITVATIANISVALFTHQWNGFGLDYTAWTYIMLAIATIVGSGVVLATRDRFYGAVLVWAFIGIALRQGGVEPGVGTAAWIATVVMALVLVAGPFIGPCHKDRVMSTSSRDQLQSA